MNTDSPWCLRGDVISDTSAMWLLLKESRRADEIVTTLLESGGEEALNGISCPLCSWRPTAEDAWCCQSQETPEPPFQSCGTMWNTFATRGKCPGCSHQWRWTSCLRCGQWSLHEEWYEANRNHGKHLT